MVRDNMTEKRVALILSHLNSDKAEVARALYERDKNLNYMVDAVDAGERAANWAREHEPMHAAYSLSFAGQDAFRVGKETGNYDWYKKSFDSNTESARIFREQGDELHAAYADGRAGDAAAAWAFGKRNLKWTTKALGKYYPFLDFFQKNPKKNLEKVMQRIERDVTKLRGLMVSPNLRRVG